MGTALFPSPLPIHLKLFTQRRDNGYGILFKKLTFSCCELICQFSTIFAPYHHSISFIKSFYKNKNTILKFNHHIQFQKNYFIFFHSLFFISISTYLNNVDYDKYQIFPPFVNANNPYV